MAAAHVPWSTLDEATLTAACATWTPPGPSEHGVAIVSACVARDPDWSLLCSTASTNHAAYAARHRYGLLLASCALPHGRSDHWSKLPLLLGVLASTGVANAFWMDADSLFLDLTASLSRFVPTPPAQLSFSGDRLCFLNSGHLMLRAGAWADGFLREAWQVYPQPLPWNEQSALAYVLGGARAECRDDVLSTRCCGARALRERRAERHAKLLMNAYIDDFDVSVSPTIHLAGKLPPKGKARLLAAYARRTTGGGGGGGGGSGRFAAATVRQRRELRVFHEAVHAHAHVCACYMHMRMCMLHMHMSTYHVCIDDDLRLEQERHPISTFAPTPSPAPTPTHWPLTLTPA